MRVAKAIFVLSALWSPAAMAQGASPSACDVVINRVSVPEVAIYETWNGNSVGKVPGAHIAPGSKVESCAPNRRMRVTIRERIVWIDSFSVETNVANAPLAPGASPALKALPPRRENNAGHRALLKKKGDDRSMVLTTYTVETPPLPPKRPAPARVTTTESNDPMLRRPHATIPTFQFVEPTSIGKFGDWTAYKVDIDKEPICFAVAQPAKRSGPPNPARDRTYLYVSARRAGTPKYEVALQAAEAFKVDAPATIELGTVKLALLTQNDNAWIDDQNQQAQVVEAMRKGPGITVKGTSQKGAPTATTFPLKGFEQALDTITNQCR